MPGLRLIASYPKSGNTWMRLFVESLAAGGAEPDINAGTERVHQFSGRAWSDAVLDAETADLTPAEVARLRPRLARDLAAMDDVPVLKVHDAFLAPPSAAEPAFPADAIGKVVYVVRDPRDVAVSSVDHFGRPLKEMVARMADETCSIGHSGRRLNSGVEQFLSSWSRHVESWLDAPLAVHAVRYEDMLADPEACLGAAARFLGMEADAATVARAVGAVSFERLAEQERAAGGFREALRPGQTFFRQGQAGAWREVLPDALARRIEADHGAVMRRLGYL